jgi:hypothetical protein
MEQVEKTIFYSRNLNNHECHALHSWTSAWGSLVIGGEVVLDATLRSRWTVYRGWTKAEKY